MNVMDETHDARRQSWVASANGHGEFPIQNLPFGIFRPAGSGPRGGVAIGDMVFDLKTALAGLLSDDAAIAAEGAAGPVLNPLMALEPGPRRALRRQLSALIAADAPERPRIEGTAGLLHDAAGCRMELPATIGNFTDFFAGIHHVRRRE
jgi:fumarylacetoacetase